MPFLQFFVFRNFIISQSLYACNYNWFNALPLVSIFWLFLFYWFHLLAIEEWEVAGVRLSLCLFPRSLADLSCLSLVALRIFSWKFDITTDIINIDDMSSCLIEVQNNFQWGPRFLLHIVQFREKYLQWVYLKMWGCIT